MSDSPIDELLESLRAALAARRRDGAARIERVEAALGSYRRAVEQQIHDREGLLQQRSAPLGMQVLHLVLGIARDVHHVQLRPLGA